MNKPIFADNGTWGKINSFCAIAIISKHPLGGIQLAILIYMIGEYNKKVFSYKDASLSFSYSDIATKCNSGTDTVKKAIKKLIDLKLIKRQTINKGRLKCTYTLNEKEINKLLKEHLKYNSEDEKQ